MSIDKTPGHGPRRSIPLGAFLANLMAYLIVLTPVLGLMFVLWAIEMGVFVRVSKEAFEWGYDLLGF